MASHHKKIKHHVKRLGHAVRQRKHARAGLFVLAFVLIGGTILLLATHAATPSVSLEAENASLTGNATTGTDSNASGGRFVTFAGPSAYGPRPTKANTGPTGSLTPVTWGQGALGTQLNNGGTFSNLDITINSDYLSSWTNLINKSWTFNNCRFNYMEFGNWGPGRQLTTAERPKLTFNNVSLTYFSIGVPVEFTMDHSQVIRGDPPVGQGAKAVQFSVEPYFNADPATLSMIKITNSYFFAPATPKDPGQVHTTAIDLLSNGEYPGLQNGGGPFGTQEWRNNTVAMRGNVPLSNSGVTAIVKWRFNGDAVIDHNYVDWVTSPDDDSPSTASAYYSIYLFNDGPDGTTHTLTFTNNIIRSAGGPTGYNFASTNIPEGGNQGKPMVVTGNKDLATGKPLSWDTSGGLYRLVLQ